MKSSNITHRAALEDRLASLQAEAQRVETQLRDLNAKMTADEKAQIIAEREAFIRNFRDSIRWVGDVVSPATPTEDWDALR